MLVSGDTCGGEDECGEERREIDDHGSARTVLLRIKGTGDRGAFDACASRLLRRRKKGEPTPVTSSRSTSTARTAVA